MKIKRIIMLILSGIVFLLGIAGMVIACVLFSTGEDEMLFVFSQLIIMCFICCLVSAIAATVFTSHIKIEGSKDVHKD